MKLLFHHFKKKMEITRTTPLSIVILQDWSKLFAESDKESLAKYLTDSKKYPYINIQWQMISTVTGNIRTIRDANDIEYYEYHILEKLPFSIFEKMHSIIWKLYDNKVTNVTLLSLINKQKTIQDEENYKKWKWLTPEEKENRRYNIMKVNAILVSKWILTQRDSDRIMAKIMNPELFYEKNKEK